MCDLRVGEEQTARYLGKYLREKDRQFREEN